MTGKPPFEPDLHVVRNAVESAIRIGLLVLLAAWCFEIVRPFITPVVWGIIIAIAVSPGYRRLVPLLGGHAGATAALLTIGMLVLLFWPTVLLSGLVVDNAQELAAQLERGELQVPPPPAAVATWPVVGGAISKAWTLASTNLEAALQQLAPQLEALAGWLLGMVAGAGLTLLQFIASIVVSGLLLANSSTGEGLTRELSERLAPDAGGEFAALAEATVRGVARGVIGVAFIQSLLAGAGMAVAGVPAAGLWALIALVLAVVQVGVAPVMLGAAIYVFSATDTLPAVLFLVYAVFVSVLDNFLKPLLMGRGLDLPMAVILVGTIGGMLSSGIVGLFVGPVVLAVAYKLFVSWLRGDAEEDSEAAEAAPVG